MPFRLKAFALHLASSACVLTMILGGLYLGWYRWPGWYLAGALRVLVIVATVDLGLGPTLTLIVANPHKLLRTLARDIAIIVAVQVVALAYGVTTLWQGRPLYYTFSVNRLELVQAADVDTGEAALARRQNPALAPHWYSRPRWVWAPLPADPQEAARIVNQAVLGSGKDVIDMPRYFKPWEQGLTQLGAQLARLEDLYLTATEKKALRARLARLGFSPEQHNALLLWGGARRLVVLFDPATLEIRAILRPG